VTDEPLHCGICGAMIYESPGGMVCESGHGDPPLVSPGGVPVFDPLPDAPFPNLDPARAKNFEARCTLLLGRVALLKRALRGMLTHAYRISDKGTAPWYQEALRALQMVERDSDGGE